MKTLRYAFWAIVALILILVGMAFLFNYIFNTLIYRVPLLKRGEDLLGSVVVFISCDKTNTNFPSSQEGCPRVGVFIYKSKSTPTSTLIGYLQEKFNLFT